MRDNRSGRRRKRASFPRADHTRDNSMQPSHAMAEAGVERDPISMLSRELDDNHDPETETYLDEMAMMATQVCQATLGAVALWDRRNDRLHVRSRFNSEKVGDGPPSYSTTIGAAGTLLKELLGDLADFSRCRDQVVQLHDHTAARLLQDLGPNSSLSASEAFRTAARLPLRFFAATPMVAAGSGLAIGFLCVMDEHPRQLAPSQCRMLATLARQTADRLELRDRLLAERQRSEELVRLHQRKDALLGMVSHDLRQPLTNITACCDMLLRDRGNRALLTDLLDTVDLSAKFMQRLVDDLLRAVESDFGQRPIQLNARETDIVRVVERAIAANVIYARRKNVTLRWRVDTPRPEDPALSTDEPLGGRIRCHLDEDRMEQVLHNLISNGIKYSHSGGLVEVLIGTTSTNAFNATTSGGERIGVSAGEAVFVSVTDHGVGIPRREMDRLFRPFARLSARPTGGESSIGLGLAIARSIVTAHRGEIRVESEEGKGSTFCVLLPRFMNPPCAPRPDSSCSLPQRDHHQLDRLDRAAMRLNVLVADDNRTSLAILKRLLHQRGHAVTTASDGREALRVFHQQGGHRTFHVLVVDEEMPGLQGTQVVMHLRRFEAAHGLPPARRLPVLVLSGCTDPDHERRAREAGADDLCAKPFRAERLLSAVERLGAAYASALMKESSPSSDTCTVHHHHHQHQHQQQAV